MGRHETCEIYKRRKKWPLRSLIDVSFRVENAQKSQNRLGRQTKKKRKKRVMNFVTILSQWR